MKSLMNRPSWDEYFMDLARLVSTRSTCMRRQVGAVLVKDKHVIAEGYNGAPSGLEHCYDVGCVRQQTGVPSGEKQELCRAVHAEQNAITYAAKHGISIDGSTLYCTTYPCSICAKMIINAGIKRIVYEGDYNDPLSVKILENESDIICVNIKDLEVTSFGKESIK